MATKLAIDVGDDGAIGVRSVYSPQGERVYVAVSRDGTVEDVSEPRAPSLADDPMPGHCPWRAVPV